MFNLVWLEPTTKYQALTDFFQIFSIFPCPKAEDNVERWVCYTVNMSLIQTD